MSKSPVFAADILRILNALAASEHRAAFRAAGFDPEVQTTSKVQSARGNHARKPPAEDDELPPQAQDAPTDPATGFGPIFWRVAEDRPKSPKPRQPVAPEWLEDLTHRLLAGFTRKRLPACIELIWRRASRQVFGGLSNSSTLSSITTSSLRTSTRSLVSTQVCFKDGLVPAKALPLPRCVSPGNQPVCRFFGVGFAPLSSHFYTAYPAECEIVKADPKWLYEKIAFGLALPEPSTNGCPVATRPLYRAWNRNENGAPNHRYTTSSNTLFEMIAAGWVFEGEAQTQVFACVPYLSTSAEI